MTLAKNNPSKNNPSQTDGQTPQPISSARVRSLTQAVASPCVSIYIPTHEAGADIQQDPIRLKNQLSEAKELLAQRDMNTEQIEQLLKPAAALLQTQSFWQHQSAGLALFIAPETAETPGIFEYYSLPTATQTLCMVDERFYIAPLIPQAAGEETFYVLAASQNKVALYEASARSVRAIDLGNTPLSLEVALRYDDPEASLQGHSSSQGGSQKIINGQGGGKDSENTDILRFFQLVAKGVETVIAGKNSPLVFVGLDFLFSIYSQVNSYPHLLETAVDHQPDQLSGEDIRDRALEIAAPHLNQRQEAVAKQYGSLADKQLATSDLPAILSAAHDGQLDTLFVAEGSQQWGRFDAESRTASLDSDRQANSQELMNLAVTMALATDAQVYVVDSAQVPGAGNMAATLRYPIVQKELVSA